MMRSLFWQRLSFLWLATAALVASSSRNGKPNFVFIITDDQDLHLGSMDYMPLTKKHLGKQGSFYSKHYCTISICCPSRVSLLTGKAAHNTNVTDVSPPYGKRSYSGWMSKISNNQRRLPEIHLSRIERQVSSGMAARGRLRHILHWQAYEWPLDDNVEQPATGWLEWN